MNLFTQGIDPQIDFSDIDEVQAHRRVLQPAAGARAQPVGRRPRLHRLLAARTRTPSRRASRRWTAEAEAKGVARRRARVGACRTCPIDPHDLGRSLRGRHPRQLPVRQGRRRLHHEDRPRARPAAPAADRVLRRRPGGADAEGGEVASGQICGRSSRTSTCPRRRRRRLGPLRALSTSHRLDRRRRQSRSRSTLRDGDDVVDGHGHGNGPIAAFLEVLATVEGVDVRVLRLRRARPLAPAATRARPPTSSAPSASACCGASGSTRPSHRLAQGRRVGRQPRRARRRAERLIRRLIDARRGVASGAMESPVGRALLRLAGVSLVAVAVVALVAPRPVNVELPLAGGRARHVVGLVAARRRRPRAPGGRSGGGCRSSSRSAGASSRRSSGS